MSDLVSDLLDRHKQIRSRVDSFLGYWQELTEVYLPDQAFFTSSPGDGERRYEDVYDGKPRVDARDLAASIDGLLKPKTSNWFWVETEDDQLNKIETVKAWFDHVRDRMWNAIYNPKAQFIQRSGETDKMLVVLGHGMLWITERSDRRGLLFKTYHM